MFVRPAEILIAALGRLRCPSAPAGEKVLTVYWVLRSAHGEAASFPDRRRVRQAVLADHQGQQPYQ